MISSDYWQISCYFYTKTVPINLPVMYAYLRSLRLPVSRAVCSVSRYPTPEQPRPRPTHARTSFAHQPLQPREPEDGAIPGNMADIWSNDINYTLTNTRNKTSFTDFPIIFSYILLNNHKKIRNIDASCQQMANEGWSQN